MNKKASSYLLGFFFLVVGLAISLGGFYFKCIKRVSGSYDLTYLNQCFSSLDTWVLIGIGALIAFIGATIIYHSKR